MGKFHTAPEPMKLIREREKEVMELPLPYRVPQYQPQLIDDAARAYAAFDNSDPFAYGRMELYCTRGYENPFQILPEFRGKVRVRELAKIMEVEKKKKDRDTGTQT